MSLIPRAKHPDGWHVVFSTYNEPEAHIIVGRLESSGVRSWIYREAVGSAMGISFGPLGEVMVLVAPEDYASARTILSEDVALLDEDDEDEDDVEIQRD